MRGLLIFFLSIFCVALATQCASAQTFGSGWYNQQNSPSSGTLWNRMVTNQDFAKSCADINSLDTVGAAKSSIYTEPKLCTAPDGDPLGAVKCLIPNIITNYELMVTQVFTQMYCRMQDSMKKPLGYVMTLFVISFGVMFLLGMVQLSAKEAITRLLKLALVWAFAMNADYGIGIAYNFLINAPKEGTTLMLNTFMAEDDPNSIGYGDDKEDFGKLLQKPLQMVLPLPLALRCKAYEVDGRQPPDDILKICTDSGIIAHGDYGKIQTGRGTQDIMNVLLLLTLSMIFLPPVFSMVLGFVIQVIVTFVRTFVAYLLALTGIALLLALSPIFLSFALFKTTYEYFSSWIRYLTSFSLQIMIIFAFLALVRMLNPVDFFVDLIKTTYPYDVEFSFHYPVKKEFGPITASAIAPVTAGMTMWSVCNGYTISNGRVKCPSTVTIVRPNESRWTGGWTFNPCGNYMITDDELAVLEAGGCTDLYKYFYGGLDDDKRSAGFAGKNKEDVLLELTKRDKNILPMNNLITDPDFIRFVVSSVLSFFIVLYVLEAALRYVPELASRLSGTGPALGYLSNDPTQAAYGSAGGASGSLAMSGTAITNVGLKPIAKSVRAAWYSRK